MRVEQGDFVSVPTRDVARAVEWYREGLGLPVSEFTEGEIETPNVTLSFWNPEADGEPFQANTAGIGLRVEDVAAAVEEIRGQGAEVIGIQDSGVATWASSRIPTATSSSCTGGTSRMDRTATGDASVRNSQDRGPGPQPRPSETMLPALRGRCMPRG